MFGLFKKKQLATDKKTYIDDDVDYSTKLEDYKVGATVRQWHHIDEFVDAVITGVYDNGALNVVTADGENYGWSVKYCAVVFTKQGSK